MGGVSSLVTISLAVDFIGTAQIGQWLSIETEVIRTGSTICFAQSLIKADGVVIARANATFRVVPKKERRALDSFLTRFLHANRYPLARKRYASRNASRWSRSRDR